MPQEQLTEEQIEALQEKLKNMSPEELKEFQKKQCIFCQIVDGKVKARKVYDDDKCIAVLDINPASPGHLLLLPKEHYTIMPQMPEDELSHIFMVAKSLSNSILRALGARGTNIIVANGPAAGQKAQHFMMHIIPRKDEDGVQFILPQKKISDKELKIIKEKLSVKLTEMLGIKKAKKEEAKKKEKAEPGEIKVHEKKEKEAMQKKPKKQKKKEVDLDDIAKILDAK